MKILCPIDFSEASLNAFKYTLKLAELLGASLVEVTHCQYGSPARKVGDSIEKEQLLQDKLRELEQTYQGQHNFRIGSSLFKGHPLDVLPPYIKAMGHELVVVGTRGLNKIRDLTIGSFTEDLIFSLDCPILVVPEGFQFTKIKTIVLAIDNRPIANATSLRMLVDLVKKTDAHLRLAHVKRENKSATALVASIDLQLKHIPYDFQSLDIKESVTRTLDGYCENQRADLLCMIHRDRGWMINIFYKSEVKEELFHLKTPLLVLSE